MPKSTNPLIQISTMKNPKNEHRTSSNFQANVQYSFICMDKGPAVLDNSANEDSEYSDASRRIECTKSGFPKDSALPRSPRSYKPLALDASQQPHPVVPPSGVQQTQTLATQGADEDPATVDPQNRVSDRSRSSQDQEDSRRQHPQKQKGKNVVGEKAAE